MSGLREAAQQALEALDRETSGNADERSVWAMLALRAALEQPNPVAAEREACAEICDQHASIEGIAQRCAAAIRGQA